MSDSNKNSLPAKDASEDSSNEGISFLQLVSSTLYAALGVQKRANRERDFARGKPGQFVVAGILFTVFFVVLIVVVVNLVLGSV